MSQMSPSNREVIVQDNMNVDGSLQYKDTDGRIELSEKMYYV